MENIKEEIELLKLKILKLKLKKELELLEDSNTFEKFKQIYAKDPDFNRSKVAKVLGVSRVTVNNWLNKTK